MAAMVAKLWDYDFEDYDLQKMKYNYVESKWSKWKCGIESSNDRARQHPPWPRILSGVLSGRVENGLENWLYFNNIDILTHKKLDSYLALAISRVRVGQ